MKFNRQQFKQPAVQLFLDAVYNGTLSGTSIMYKGMEVAKRVSIPVVQDAVYKTQFFNETLRSAVVPKNKNTAVKLYDINNQEITNPTNYCTLLPEYGSIVFKFEPSPKPVYIECCIYNAYTAQDVLLTDGSTGMNIGYIPNKATDVVTKEFLEQCLTTFRSATHTLQSISVLQDGLPPVQVVCNATGKLSPVLIPNTTTTTVRTSPCMVHPLSSTTDTYITLSYGSVNIFREKLTDVIQGSGSSWSLISSIDTKEVDGPTEPMYLLNTYECTFSSQDLRRYVGVLGTIPTALTVSISDGTYTQEASIEIGLDENRRTSLQPELFISDVALQQLRTLTVSGESYFPNSQEAVDAMGTLVFKNRTYVYYRPTGIAYGVTYESGEDVLLGQHTLTDVILGDNIDYIPMQLTNKVRKLFIEPCDLFGVPIERVYTDTDCSTTTYLEITDTYRRVYTPDGTVENPDASIMSVWDSTKQLEPFEPKLTRTGLYTCDSANSAVCFQLDPVGHYSGINLDLETDGRVQVMSYLNTGWLDFNKPLDVFTTPTVLGEGCNAGTGIASFGRVNYIGPIFVRIVGASTTRFNGWSLR